MGKIRTEYNGKGGDRDKENTKTRTGQFFYVKGHHRLKATRNINTLVKILGNEHSRLAMVCIILESVL